MQHRVIRSAIAFILLLGTLALQGCSARRVEGNTQGNLLHGGLAVEADGWLYYTTYDSLYKVGVHSGTPRKLADTQGTHLNIMDGWLYYISPEYYAGIDREAPFALWLENNIATKSIYKMRLDGTNKQRVSDGTYVNDLYVDQNGLYYSTSSEPNLVANQIRLWHLPFGSTAPALLTDHYERGLSLYKNTLYFIGTKEGNRGIYRMNPDGKKETLLLETMPLLLLAAGDWIYFTYYDGHKYDARNHQIYRIRLDGTGLEQFSAHRAYALNELSGWLYVAALSDEGCPTDCARIHCESKQEEEVATGDFDAINLAGQSIFWFNSDRPNCETLLFFRMSLKGGQKEELH